MEMEFLCWYEAILKKVNLLHETDMAMLPVLKEILKRTRFNIRPTFHRNAATGGKPRQQTTGDAVPG